MANAFSGAAGGLNIRGLAQQLEQIEAAPIRKQLLQDQLATSKANQDRLAQYQKSILSARQGLEGAKQSPLYKGVIGESDLTIDDNALAKWKSFQEAQRLDGALSQLIALQGDKVDPAFANVVRQKFMNGNVKGGAASLEKLTNMLDPLEAQRREAGFAEAKQFVSDADAKVATRELDNVVGDALSVGDIEGVRKLMAESPANLSSNMFNQVMNFQKKIGVPEQVQSKELKGRLLQHQIKMNAFSPEDYNTGQEYLDALSSEQVEGRKLINNAAFVSLPEKERDKFLGEIKESGATLKSEKARLEPVIEENNNFDQIFSEFGESFSPKDFADRTSINMKIMGVEGLRSALGSDAGRFAEWLKNNQSRLSAESQLKKATSLEVDKTQDEFESQFKNLDSQDTMVSDVMGSTRLAPSAAMVGALTNSDAPGLGGVLGTSPGLVIDSAGGKALGFFNARGDKATVVRMVDGSPQIQRVGVVTDENGLRAFDFANADSVDFEGIIENVKSPSFDSQPMDSTSEFTRAITGSIFSSVVDKKKGFKRSLRGGGTPTSHVSSKLQNLSEDEAARLSRKATVLNDRAENLDKRVSIWEIWNEDTTDRDVRESNALMKDALELYFDAMNSVYIPDEIAPPLDSL